MSCGFKGHTLELLYAHEYTQGERAWERGYHPSPLTARPTPNTDIDRYHTVAVGGGVKLECGIKQGALGSMYEPQWFHNKSYKVDTRTVGSRFQINRNFLEDLSLNIAFLNLRDNGTYHCDVEVGTSYAEEGPPVELLVYGE